MEDQRVADLLELTGELARVGVDRISRADLTRIFSDEQGAYARMLTKLYAWENEPLTFYRDYALRGQMNSLREAWTGVRRDGKRKFNRPLLDELAGLNDRAIYRRMVAAAFARPRVISSDPDRSVLTPSVAHLLLYEILRDRLDGQPERLRAFLNRTRLKYDIAAPYDAVLSDPDYVIIHDGYALGALAGQQPSDRRRYPSVGMDCTSFVESCVDPRDPLSARYKLISTRLVALGNPELESEFSPEEVRAYHERFESAPYCCPEQLRVGDIIATIGHAFVFGGMVKEADGRFRMVTYEALGGEYRTAGRFLRELPRVERCGLADLGDGEVVPLTVVHYRERALAPATR